MIPIDFLKSVVEPNVVTCTESPGDLRHVCNAVLVLDACAGILYQYLRKNYLELVSSVDNDSTYKWQIASKNHDFRIARDAAFTFKHGALNPKNRVMFSTEAVSHKPNILGHFQCGDRLGGYLIYIDIKEGCDVRRRRASDVVCGAFRFLQTEVALYP